MSAQESRPLQVYKKKGLYEDIAKYLNGVGVETLEDLVTFCDTKDQVQGKILIHVDSQKDILQQQFRTKQAWMSACETMTEESDKRKQGWDIDELDNRLEPDDQREIM